MTAVRKAVIPAGGLGTRLLPATKAVPKEMLPLVDKPTIQYAVEEAVGAGIRDIVLVTGQRKHEIEDHFDHDYRLEAELQDSARKEQLQSLEEVIRKANFASVRQQKPLGLGHAVKLSEPFVGKEPFGVLLPDDIFVHEVPCTRQLLEVYETHGASVIAVQEVPDESVSRYGIVSAEPVAGETDRIFRVREMVEKPPVEEAPSNLAIMGRYILTPGIFQTLEEIEPGAGGEIQLTDAIRALLGQEEVYACRFEGVRHDAGTRLGYLISAVELALQRPDIGEDFRAYLKGLKL